MKQQNKTPWWRKAVVLIAYVIVLGLILDIFLKFSMAKWAGFVSKNHDRSEMLGVGGVQMATEDMLGGDEALIKY